MSDPSTTPPTTAYRSTANLERELAGVEGGRKWLKRLVALVVLVGLVAGGIVWRKKNAPPPPPRYMTQALTEGDVVETVQSTGVVKPLTEVKVGAQVSGRVARVVVDFNSQVKRGDLLAEIDPMLLGAQVQQQRSQMAAQRASKAGAEARVQMAQISLDRLKQLRAENLVNQAEIDQAQGQLDVAKAEVAQIKAQLGASAASIAAAGANLSFTKIYAPIDGVVTDRQIDEGQTVAASFQTPVLFTIAEDLRKMRVYADVDEADVGKLMEGMAAETQVDAFPGERFKGTVGQVRFNPNSVQGVVTYTAVIEVSNPERKLRPGMTATVTVRTKEARKAQRLPNAALRFKPTPEKGPDGKPLPTPPEKPLDPGTGRIYLLTDGTPGKEKIEPRILKVGVTDGVHTALLEPLDAAVKVVIDEADDKDAKKRGGPRIF
jgi:HlyD family secretion protein